MTERSPNITPIPVTTALYSAGRCASTTRTPTPAASSTTRTTSNSWSARAPNGCARWASSCPRWRTNTAFLFVVRAVEIEYLKPARFNDELDVTRRTHRPRPQSDRDFPAGAARARGARRPGPGSSASVRRRIRPVAFRTPCSNESYQKKRMNNVKTGIATDLSLLSLITNASVLVQLVMAILLSSRCFPGGTSSSRCSRSGAHSSRPTNSSAASGAAPT